MNAAARAWANQGPVPSLLAALAFLTLVTLLFVFQQVVNGAVTQGALRRSVAAQVHSATWQCKALRGLREQQDCLLLIPLAARPVDAARDGAV